VSFKILVNLLMINVIGCHFWCPKHGLCVLWIILRQNHRFFFMKICEETYRAVNIGLLRTTNSPCLPLKGNCKGTDYSKSFRKMLQNDRCLHLALGALRSHFGAKS
jgi:hypothetical protein